MHDHEIRQTRIIQKIESNKKAIKNLNDTIIENRKHYEVKNARSNRKV